MKRILQYSFDLQIIFVAALYFLFASLGYFLVFEEAQFLPIWPPSGLALALLIILGRKVWPGITIGALLANMMAFWNTGTLQTGTIIILSTSIAISYTVEALTGNFLIKRFIDHSYPFDKTKNAFHFLFITLFIAGISSAISTFSIWLNQVHLNNELFNYAVSWWVSDIVGILLFTPFILALRYKHVYHLNGRKILEVASLAIIITVIVLLLRAEEPGSTLENAVPYLIFPVMLWLAFRFNLIIAITCTLLVSLTAIYFTVNQLGPFVMDDAYNSMLLLQVFIGVISISTIILSATVKEREQAQQALKSFNESLESKVKERTKALEEEIQGRKLKEEEIQKANEELRKTNAELDNFVYSVSHDLRSPLASMLGLVDIAKQETSNDKKNYYLDLINQSAQKQDNFITDILDQSRNSRLEIKNEPVMFDEIINETFEQLKFANIDDNVTKEININQEQPFHCDPWRLKVIFNNLLSNSIRYRNGKDPKVNIDVNVNEDKASISIKDNGKGISKDHLDKVYNMFYRATDDNAGSGLGLYIVKETINKLNGSIDINSKVGEGTTVDIEIPTLNEN